MINEALLQVLRAGSTSDISKYSDLLMSYCQDLQLVITRKQSELCVQHLLYVVQANNIVNLTRITDLEDAVVLHILDSLALIPLISRFQDSCNHGIRILDMGTGAGFPSIPLSIVLNQPVTALDSVGKKIQAVSLFGQLLNLNEFHAVHSRLEEFALSHLAAFNLVVARAVASLPVLLEYASPYLPIDGLAVFAKAKPSDNELEAGNKASKICGFELVSVSEFELPLNFGHRSIFVYKKVHDPFIDLPRANGLAKKKPLG